MDRQIAVCIDDLEFFKDKVSNRKKSPTLTKGKVYAVEIIQEDSERYSIVGDDGNRRSAYKKRFKIIDAESLIDLYYSQRATKYGEKNI